MAECSLNGLKTPCEKEKLLVTSNFSFSHSVFKRRCTADTGKTGLVWERFNWLIHVPFVALINVSTGGLK